MNSTTSLTLKKMTTLPLLATLLTMGSITGCGTLGMSDNSMVRDVYDIKENLKKVGDEQSANQRKNEYHFSSIEESLSGRGDITKNSIDELQKRIKEQNDEMTQLKVRVEELAFGIDSLSKRLGGGSTTQNPMMNTAPGDTTTPPTIPPTDTNTTAPPAPGSGSAIDQAIEASLRKFHLGDFAGARDGFKQAVALNPEGDQKVEAYFWLAESENNLKNTSAAYQDYTQAIQANNTHAKAWVSLERMADIKMQQGDKPAALLMLRQIEKNSFYPDLKGVRDKIARIQASNGAGGPGATQ